MRQGWLLAVTMSAVAGGTCVSAQGPSAPSRRPFTELFGASPAPAKPIVPLAPRTTVPALPSGREKCHVVVLPADPRIDPRMSIAPPASRRFTIRDAAPVCR